jgi:hypothetical protein
VTSATRRASHPPSRGLFRIKDEERVLRDARVELGWMIKQRSMMHKHWKNVARDKFEWAYENTGLTAVHGYRPAVRSQWSPTLCFRTSSLWFLSDPRCLLSVYLGEIVLFQQALGEHNPPPAVYLDIRIPVHCAYTKHSKAIQLHRNLITSKRLDAGTPTIHSSERTATWICPYPPVGPVLSFDWKRWWPAHLCEIGWQNVGLAMGSKLIPRQMSVNPR